MRLFGWLIPSFRKGTYVIVDDPACARGKEAETIFAYLDPQSKYDHNLYGIPKRHSKGLVISLIRYKNTAGTETIYYGVLLRNILYAIEEAHLARA
ncbi:hypothetical protein B5M42_000825 [Paenibacillus athensensis]|uniref:Uncharacterized protein n=1 Tax=Paenibacillus athensensis TaxID=1967502 RepID=A0A4Y8Q8E9_9BACL|nr:hypothetical protein [Paenibacillus athensensis]MCD1257378.1 hypothetical protein [Paenibacillus athensensis]